MLHALALAAAIALQPSVSGPPAEEFAPIDVGFDRATGFSTIVINHVNRIIGTENLPVANGGIVEPGMFVTVAADRIQVFDHDAVALQGGRVQDPTAAPQCVSGCPAVLFDAFSYEWLRLAVESSSHAVRIPQFVHIAMQADLPASTLLQVAYAAAETRPALPPALSLLVNMPGRGLRAQPFLLLPPEGLELQQGSAALGLTITFGKSSFRVSASDSALARQQRAKSLKGLKSILIGVKKRHPGKDAVILVPGDKVTVADLVVLIRTLGDDFPVVILSLGQDVIL